MMAASIERLVELGLLRAGQRAPDSRPSLRALCAAGVLEGGLSVASDIRPTDLVGPLCSYLGGPAARLRVLEALSEPAEVWVLVGGKEERWPTPDVAALVTHLNRCYRREPQVPAIARLGRWEDAWQFWCISKRVLTVVLREKFFEAENSAELSALE